MGTRFDPIKNRAQWEKADVVDEYLTSHLSQGSVSLVLGAGASMGFGLPNWDDLVKLLYRGKGEKINKGKLSAADLSDRLKAKHFAKSEVDFAEYVRTHLYKNADEEALLSSPLLQALNSFLVNSIRGRAGSVISFNFDDLLERYLIRLGFVVRSVPNAPYWHQSADVQVLHPHGLLPLDTAAACTRIVFTSTDYDHVIGKPEAWNLSMSAILGGSAALFVGLSGDDQRLRSLLHDINKIHPGRLAGQPYWAVRPTVETDDPHNVSRWAAMGVAPRKLKNYDELAPWLLRICQSAALRRRPC